jgi:hypothetical protein
LFELFDETKNSKENLIKKTADTYEHMARNIYGPILVPFVDWILENHNNTGKISFLARD